ncbi:MAG: hypothetical protein AAFV45_10580 [Pseudomonadota bacterium]
MTWSLRAGFGFLSFGVAGLGLLAINPAAESANDPDQHGYVFAISHGPGLSLANAEQTLPTSDAGSSDASDETSGHITAFAQTARSLACEVVLTIGSIEVGSRCAFDLPEFTATEQTASKGTPMTTGSISGSQF